MTLVFLYFEKKQLGENFFYDPLEKQSSSVPFLTETELSNALPYNHASSLTALGEKWVAWVGGKAELDPGIQLYVAKEDNEEKFDVKPFLDKKRVEQDENRYLRSLGNPVVLQYAGKLWIFFASTLGGWSTASLQYIVSEDDGLTWSKARVLKLSPWLNFSKGLKGSPVFFQDGTLGLPIYTEFLDYRGELLRLNAAGQIVSLQRLSWNGQALQPVVIPTQPRQAIALMRQTHSPLKKLFATQTQDGGQTWSKPFSTEIDNPDSAVTGIKLEGNQFLVVGNQQDRQSLDFMLLDKNLKKQCSWPFKTAPGGNIAYPFLVRDGQDFWLSYTFNSQIRVAHFNQAWLIAEGEKHCPS